MTTADEKKVLVFIGPRLIEESFFMTAGAGAGKTGALVACVRSTVNTHRESLAQGGAKVAVITYTKAAAQEAQSRIGNSALVAVSTIHSFAWSMISALTLDLKYWRAEQLTADIALLKEKEAKGKSGTKASKERLESIAQKERSLDGLDRTHRFSYGATNGTDEAVVELNHFEVLSAFTWLCEHRPLFVRMTATLHPFIFIDEVQDTRQDVLSALIQAAVALPDRLRLGLFGDPMQRVYTDGAEDLNGMVPPNWPRPVLPLNYRSGPRIVQLLNKLRSDQDGVVQSAFAKVDSAARLYLESPDTTKPSAEKLANAWLTNTAEPKLLILEHGLAAGRLGFTSLWELFADVSAALRSELFDKESAVSSSLHFLADVLAPFARAAAHGDMTTASQILQDVSRFAPASSSGEILMRRRAERVYETLRSEEISLGNALKAVIASDLFPVPRLLHEAAAAESPDLGSGGSDRSQAELSRVAAWARAGQAPLREWELLALYALGRAPIDTQQGTKGLEFETVLVLLNDYEARGFLFRYEKLFEVQSLSAQDLSNLEGARDNVLWRTLRLFYVACSRARRRLAVVLITSDPAEARETAVRNGWFDRSEVVLSVD